MNEYSKDEILSSPTFPEEEENLEKKETVSSGAKNPHFRSHSDKCVLYKEYMGADGSQEDNQIIIDSPPLPETTENSQTKTKETVEEGAQSDNPSGNSSSCHHHLMTTRELQLYWNKEKYNEKPVKLLFQIQSTRIAEDFLSKFVMYQIVIIKTGSFDGKKVFIERRYSDFENLHRNLLKDYKEEMEDIVFPKKVLMGNLNEEMINKRMVTLKDYLEELYSIKCIRKSQKFIAFFIEHELEEGYSCIRGGQYSKAVGIIQQVIYLQEKLVEHFPTLMVPSLCALVVCHKDLNQSEVAYEFGMKAVELLEKHTTHKYYTPLLDTLISLAYKIGKDFVMLREKLQINETKLKRTFDFEMLTLKELVIQEYVRD